MCAIRAKVDDFKSRNAQHDEAMGIVADAFSQIGFSVHNCGIEERSPELHQALMQQYDRTSISQRWQPDQVAVKRGNLSLLCEVKSEGNGYPNFAIEADSFTASHVHAQSGQAVMYAFVDLLQLPEPTIHCCWLDDVPSPEFIRVPMRWDWRKTYDRLKESFPNATLNTVNHKGGAGTAYFLIKKDSSYLIPFDIFAQAEFS